MNIIKISRPVFWPVAMFAFITGFLYSGANFSILALIQMILLAFPLSFVTFGINDVYDYETDKINKRKGSFEGEILKPIYHKSVIMLSLLFSALLILFSLITFNITNIVSMILLIFIVFSYSVPPLRLKEKPPFDSLSNGIMAFLTFLVGFSYNGTFLELDKKIYLAALCLAGMHAFTTIADYRYDKKAGQKTFSIVFGKRTAVLFAFFTFLIAYFLGNFSFFIGLFLLISCFIFLINFVVCKDKITAISSRIIFALGIVLSSIYLYQNAI